MVFVVSPLSMQHKGERAKTGWLGIRIMCPNEVHISIRGLLFQRASTIKIQLRDRPFNLQGGYVFCFVQKNFFGQHES